MKLKRIASLLLCGLLTVIAVIESPAVAYAAEQGVSEDGGTQAGKAKATGDVLVNAKNFPNEDFRFFYVYYYDKNGDGVLSISERNAVKSINVSYSHSSGLDITDLTGIEFFPNLAKLECEGNQMTKLDISKNPNLVELNCSWNQISKLDTSKNKKLKKLICDNNEIKKLDLRNNKKLTYLECMKNQISSLNVRECKDLKFLSCRKNLLTKIDVSQNKKLTWLDCAMNLLRDIKSCKKVISLKPSKADFSFNYLTKKELTSKLPRQLATNKSWIKTQVEEQSKIAKPTKLKASKATKNSVKLTWKKAKSVSGYQVYVATSKNGTYKKIADSKKLTFTHKKLKKNRTYYYKIRSYKKISGVKVYSAWTGVVSKKTLKK